jgi:hypothetical protein
VTVLLPVALAVLAGVAWWIAQSLIRMALVVPVTVVTGHVPVQLVPVLAVALIGLAARIVWRALAPCGWRLIVTTPPRTAPPS